MKQAFLLRLLKQADRTLGRFFLFDGTGQLFSGTTLELPWLGNANRISCIPCGSYHVTPRESRKFGDHFILNDVGGRQLILIHPGNLVSDTQGCIILGSRFEDLDRDGKNDVTGSRAALAGLLQSAPEGFMLTISEVPS